MKKKDIFVSGLALFAMFFGAGNLIFPPYLGLTGGKLWLEGLACFILVEVVISGLGICAMIAGGGSISTMEISVGKVPGFLLNTAAILCTGVFIAPPRTAATTYEMAILPLTDKIGLLPFSIVFFAIVFVLTIRPTQIVDIIGKRLTPILVIGILILIVVGILNPIGEVGGAVTEHIARDGLVAGYQAMDIISVAGFTIVIQNNMIKKGIHDHKAQVQATIGSSVVAGFLLTVIYGGLTYLGATVGSTMGYHYNQAELIVTITHELLGKPGVVILGTVVGFACLTTSIGLFGATASYFEKITNGKFSYKTGIVILSIVGITICNMGLSAIIEMATPVLCIITPPFMTTVILVLFHSKIKNRNLYKGAAAVALIASILITFHTYLGGLDFIENLPLYDTGFGWLIPAVIGGICGSLFNPKENK